MSNNILSKIRLHLKHSFDRLNNEQLKKNVLQAIPFWIASVITGLIAVVYARLFLYAEDLTAKVFHWHAWLLFILTPVCFIAAWWIVKRFATYSRGSGIPQVAAAIEITGPKTDDKVNKLLSIKIIVVKVISSLVLAIGGGAIGREGPTIQIAASVFRKINQILPAWWPKVAKRNMIITGAAAGLAAAFNTPLGGIVFAIEELTKTHFSYFKTAIFSSVIIAGLTAQGILGPYLYLGYPKIDSLSTFIFLSVALVAAITGLLGSAMSKFILVILKWKAKFRFQREHVIYLVCCALIMVTFAYFVNFAALGSGKDVMQRVLFTSDKYSTWYMPVFRIIGPALSFTTGAAGGIFAPALGAGASVGSFVASWFNFSEANTNMLILAGMVGFLTGVTRSPFTSAILVLEMTDRNNVIFHLILAGMIASLAAMLVDKHSLYDHLKVQYMIDLKAEEEKENAQEEPTPAVIEPLKNESPA
ncbi:chloride channel protein [Mucilaginibacter ginsenosidivorans]|uniref:Chloride channel protein n=1 Tax=Mucilaginibacter ginsenosidivorans TaxID=398053 RepID=A0A5B8UYF8_9SPHI|nr:chloride channel protein [Mucilaginibacter ginsenosidivorans]QEC64022.1 chloride channel protein [Mucilaginibacter ginsenosidivorans]